MPLSRPSAIGSYLGLHGSPVVIRARMASVLPRLAVRRDPVARALASALASTAAGRVPAAEREWARRIESRRAELASRPTETRARFVPGPNGLPQWAPAFDRPVEMSGATELLSIPPLWGLLLLRLVRELEPRACVELGTAFGISTAFQAAGLELNGAGKAITIDAAREWTEIAEEGWAQLGLEERIALRLGQIEGELEAALEDAGKLDFAFVDAEHQEEPTVGYLEAMLPRLSERAVVVWDDINFPRQMRRAWATIKRHPRVDLALGLGRIGITTFR